MSEAPAALPVARRGSPRARRWAAYAIGTVLAAAVFAAIAVGSRRAEAVLDEPAVVSGYALVTVFVLLATLNARKRLRVLPLGSAHGWLVAHVVGGFLGLALFALHAGIAWPPGPYERWLAALVYLVSLSGIVGLVLQHTLPRRLTRTGVDVIFERIPTEIARLKRRAESEVLACTRATGHDTLSRFYGETLAWFFFRPRFLLGHLLGSQAAEFWLERQLDTVRRHLTEAERQHLAALDALARHKIAIDAQHSGQLLLRGWLLAHVPAATALLVLAFWHLLLVHVYAL